MNTPDISALTLAQLLYMQSCIREEIRRRGVSRTSGSLEGEIGEAIALAVYGGVLAAPGTRGYDLTDAMGRKIQVKTRTLPKGTNRIFQFKSETVDRADLDLALCIRFDRDTNTVEWAREYTSKELIGLLTPHKQGPRLPTGRAQRFGTDVTARIQEAFEGLGGTTG